MKREPTLIYSILIEDKAVIALEAGASEARGLCKEEWFLEDLSRLRSMANRSLGPGCEYALGRPPKRSGSSTTKHAARLTMRTTSYSFVWRIWIIVLTA